MSLRWLEEQKMIWVVCCDLVGGAGLLKGLNGQSCLKDIDELPLAAFVIRRSPLPSEIQPLL